MQAPNFLDWQFYHNTLRAWMVAGIIFLVIAASLIIIRKLITRRLAKLAERTATTADDAIVDLLRGTRHFFIITAAVAGAALFLELPTRAHVIGAAAWHRHVGRGSARSLGFAARRSNEVCVAAAARGTHAIAVATTSGLAAPTWIATASRIATPPGIAARR